MSDLTPQTTEIKSLIEQSNRAFEEFKKANEENIKKQDIVLEEKLQKLNTELDAIKSATDKEIAALKRPSLGETKAQDEVHAKGLRDYIRKGVVTPEFEQKALSAGTSADGGYSVTPELDSLIIQTMKEVSPIRSIASVRQTSTGTFDRLVNKHGTDSGWVGETASRPATNTSQFDKISFPAQELYAMPTATQVLLDDSAVNIEQWIADEVGLEFAQKEGAAFVSGDGTNKPKGFIAGGYTIAADASATYGQLGYIASGAAGAWAASNPSDKLIDLVYALKAGYRQNATFVLNRNTLATIRKFKDSQGNYLWQPGVAAGQPSTILGYPVVEAEDMPSVAANSYSVAFGDFRRGYLIVDRLGVRVLRDPYSSKPYIAFYTTKRVGGGVQDFAAIKLLKFAAS